MAKKVNNSLLHNLNQFYVIYEIDKKGDKGDEPEEEAKEEGVEFLGKAPKKKDTRVTYYRKFKFILPILYNHLYIIKSDTPLPLPAKKFDKDIKKENEQIR